MKQIRYNFGSRIAGTIILMRIRNTLRGIKRVYIEDGLGRTLIRATKLALGRLMPSSIEESFSKRALQKRMATEHGADDVLDTAYYYVGWGDYFLLKPQQIRDELRELVAVVERHQPRTIVEIGTGQGGTFYTWSRVLGADQIISIDLPNSPDRRPILQMAAGNTETVFLKRNSHNQETKSILESHLQGPIDFLYIDGDHSYNGVKNDFKQYAPLVADGGLIALHDVENQNVGVPDFWRELKRQYQTTMISSDEKYYTQESNAPNQFLDLGIGIVHYER